MMRILILVSLALSCTDRYEALAERCGLAPGTPGVVAAFETINGQRRALMTPEAYAELIKYRADISAWARCAEGK